MSRDVIESLDAYLVDKVDAFSVPHWLMQQTRDEVSALREQVKSQQKLRANLLMQSLVETFELEPWMLEYFLAEPEFREKLHQLRDLIEAGLKAEPLVA